MRTKYKKFFIEYECHTKKNDKAQKTADNALTLIISLGGLVFLIAFTFTCKFPFDSYQSYQSFDRGDKRNSE